MRVADLLLGVQMESLVVAQGETRPRIAGIRVRALFGEYDYEIELPQDDSAISRLLLLYGDNGSGKTTLLELLFHLLSPSDSSGHRTSIGTIPFQSFGVRFTDGSSIGLYRDQAGVGGYRLALRINGQAEQIGRWSPDDKRPTIVRKREMRERRLRYHQEVPEDVERVLAEITAWDNYIAFLQRFRPAPLYLADDRVLYSDEFEKAAEDEQTRSMRIFYSGREEESPKRAVTSQLRDAISRANDYLQAAAIGGTSTGSASANQLYLDVLRRLAEAPDSEHAVEVDLIKRIDSVRERAKRFHEFRLAPAIDGDAFKAIMRAMPEHARSAAQNVLLPHLESLDARMNALQDVEAVIRIFVDNVNSFLTGKRISYSPTSGLEISTISGDPLSPDLLSSGEKQLVLLLCNALLARNGSGLFLIDEPEISLNVKWQRKLLPAVLACTEGTDVQFVVATHSLELISGHRQSLARLAQDHVLG